MTTKTKPIADRYFDVCRLEYELDETLMRTFGATADVHGDTDVKTWPCTHIVYDDYDSSFELWGIKDDAWTPTTAQLAAALALGFARCWFVWPDGTERYCCGTTLYDRQPSSHGRDNQNKYLRAKLLRELAPLHAQRASIEQWLTHYTYSNTDGAGRAYGASVDARRILQALAQPPSRSVAVDPVDGTGQEGPTRDPGSSVSSSTSSPPPQEP